jgi:CarD family transcriptional regulator
MQKGAETVYSVGDKIVHPQHGAGMITKIDRQEVRGRQCDYFTIQILHNRMTVMVPVENAALAGLRSVVAAEVVNEVLEVLRDDPSEMPENWSQRYRLNRDKLKSGDVFAVAEVVRNLATREAARALPPGEKEMLTRAKRILASELMYARDLSEDKAMALLRDALTHIHGDGPDTA